MNGLFAPGLKGVKAKKKKKSWHMGIAEGFKGPERTKNLQDTWQEKKTFPEKRKIEETAKSHQFVLYVKCYSKQTD